MTAILLKQNPNTKRFKQTLICFDRDTQYAHFQGSCLFQSSVNQTLTSLSLSLNLYFTEVYILALMCAHTHAFFKHKMRVLVPVIAEQGGGGGGVVVVSK